MYLPVVGLSNESERALEHIRCHDRFAQAAFTNETYMPRLAAVFAVLVGTGATGRAGVYTKGVFVNSSE